MAFKVSYLEDVGAVEAVYSGTVTVGEVDGGVAATGILAAEHLCNRFLIDSLGQDGCGSAFDILKLAEFLASLPPGTIDREAILPPRSSLGVEDFRFFETAARNRGLNVRLFTSRDEALAWLAE